MTSGGDGALGMTVERQLPVASCQLPVASCQSPTLHSYGDGAWSVDNDGENENDGGRQLPVPSHQCPATATTSTTETRQVADGRWQEATANGYLLPADGGAGVGAGARRGRWHMAGGRKQRLTAEQEQE